MKAMVQIHLTKKFANMIDGIDLSRMRVGQILWVPAWVADTLIAEGWAVAYLICSTTATPISASRLPARRCGHEDRELRLLWRM